MNKFEVGDTVECISVKQRPGESEAWTRIAGCVVGDIYRIKEADRLSNNIKVSVNGYWVPATNFKKYSKSIKCRVRRFLDTEDGFVRSLIHYCGLK